MNELGAAIATCGAIYRAINEGKKQKYVLAAYERKVRSFQDVLHGAVYSPATHNTIHSMRVELEELGIVVNDVVNMSKCEYMWQARKLQQRLSEHVETVKDHIISYMAQMSSLGQRVLSPAQQRAVQDLVQLNMRWQAAQNAVENAAPEAAPGLAIIPAINPLNPLAGFIDRLKLAERDGVVTPPEKQIIQNSYEVLIPQADDAAEEPRWNRWKMCYFLLFLVLVAVPGYLIYHFVSPSESEALALDSTSSTLSAILNRGYLECGVTYQLGYATVDEEGHWIGFEVDVCRAIGAGIFGKDRFQGGRGKEPVKFKKLEAADRFKSLSNKDIDVLLGITSQTLERSVNEVRRRQLLHDNAV